MVQQACGQLQPNSSFKCEQYEAGEDRCGGECKQSLMSAAGVRQRCCGWTIRTWLALHPDGREWCFGLQVGRFLKLSVAVGEDARVARSTGAEPEGGRLSLEGGELSTLGVDVEADGRRSVCGDAVADGTADPNPSLGDGAICRPSKRTVAE